MDFAPLGPWEISWASGDVFPNTSLLSAVYGYNTSLLLAVYIYNFKINASLLMRRECPKPFSVFKMGPFENANFVDSIPNFAP